MKEFELRVTSSLLSKKPEDDALPVAILGGLVLSFISMLCWWDPDLYQGLAATRTEIVSSQEYWRLTAAIAVHADFKHLFSNVVFVVFFGYLLYGYFGFWVYPAGMIILSSLTNFFSLLTYPPDVGLIGASGLVYVMVGFWLTMYTFVERTISLKKRLLRAIGISLIVLLPTTAQPNVSYRTHAIGCALGVLAAAAYFHRKKAEIRDLEVVELEPFD